MNTPSVPVGRASSLLNRQFADLLSYLESSQTPWIDSQWAELSDVPPALENHIQKILFTLTDLQKKLKSSGFANLHQWEETKATESEDPTPGEQLKELAHQVRKLAKIQNALAQNLLGYLRGMVLLDQNRKDAIYSQANKNGKSLGYLRYRG
jgi:hypothetical protein